MRIAISGTGLRSRHVLGHFRDQMEEVEFVGFVDPQATYASKIEPDMPQFEDVDTMLAETKPDLLAG